MMQFPKPKKKKKQRRSLYAPKLDAHTIKGIQWREYIISLDLKCMDLNCECHIDRLTDFRVPLPLAWVLDAHHIKSRGRGGLWTAENGITLCRSIAHKAADEGRTVDGQRYTATEYMIYVLKQHEGKPYFRWHEALEYLEKRVNG